MPGDVRFTRSTAEEEALIKKIIEKVLSSDILKNELIDKIRNEIVSEYKNEVKALTSKVEQLELELSTVKMESKRSTDDLEQYSRRNSVRIFGVPVKDNEDTNQLVIDLCQNKLGLTILPGEIDCSHRLRAKEPNHPPIIVKFVNRNIKKRIYSSKKALKGSKIVIKEDLTALRNQLLKQAAKKYGGRAVWSNDGRIFAKVQDKVKIIKSSLDLV